MWCKHTFRARRNRFTKRKCSSLKPAPHYWRPIRSGSPSLHLFSEPRVLHRVENVWKGWRISRMCPGLTALCRTATLLSAVPAVTTKIFLIPPDFPPRTAPQTKRKSSAGSLWRPPLGGCAGQPPIQMLVFFFFLLSHSRFKRGMLWERKLLTAFPLRQPHNGSSVCGEGVQADTAAGKESLCTCWPTKGWHGH